MKFNFNVFFLNCSKLVVTLGALIGSHSYASTSGLTFTSPIGFAMEAISNEKILSGQEKKLQNKFNIESVQMKAGNVEFLFIGKQTNHISGEGRNAIFGVPCVKIVIQVLAGPTDVSTEVVTNKLLGFVKLNTDIGPATCGEINK